MSLSFTLLGKKNRGRLCDIHVTRPNTVNHDVFDLPREWLYCGDCSARTLKKFAVALVSGTVQ